MRPDSQRVPEFRISSLFSAAVISLWIAVSGAASAQTNSPSDTQFLRQGLLEEVRTEFYQNLLPFWLEHAPERRGDGFVGKLYNDLGVDTDVPKALSVTARLLWFYSAAHRLQPDDRCAQAARRAFDYLNDHFEDDSEDGYFWQVTFYGGPMNRRKMLYGHAFVLYGYAEYFPIVEKERLAKRVFERIQEIFELIETRFQDAENGLGYIEVLRQNWTPQSEAALSGTVPPGGKTMNAHLHVLEAYANLFRVWPVPETEAALRRLIQLHMDKMLNAEEGFFYQEFDAKWNPLDASYSFGHDMEAAWLLCDAARTLADEKLIQQTESLCLKIADRVLRLGMDADGGIFSTGRDGRILDAEKIWWAQAESLVGFVQAWQISADVRYLQAANKCWQFIKTELVDPENGEWFESSSPDKKRPGAAKISEWKGPYHNGRACMELIRRLQP